MSRDITNYDLMSIEAELPHLSIGAEDGVRLGGGDGVRTFDFSRSTIPLDETVTLHASRGRRAAHRQFKAVEIRIADGYNYYFEYRRTQGGGIGDQQLATTRHGRPAPCSGPCHAHAKFTFPIAQPQIMPARARRRGRELVLHLGQDYKETDSTSSWRSPTSR